MKKGSKSYGELEENNLKMNIKTVYDGMKYQTKSKQELLARIQQTELRKYGIDSEETYDYVYLNMRNRKKKVANGVSFLKLGASIVTIAAVIFLIGILIYNVHIRFEKQKEAAVDRKEIKEQINKDIIEQNDNSQYDSRDSESEHANNNQKNEESNQFNEGNKKDNLYGIEIEVPVRVPIEELHLSGEFNLSDYYLTNVVQPENQYMIDKEGILWGLGDNRAGQLGQGVQGYYGEAYVDYTKEPVKIAENVAHVDASRNYFAVFLTEDGSLYGMGANFDGLMGIKQVGSYFSHSTDVCAIHPVLLMKDVSYARCGEYHILVLKKDGTVWKIGDTKDDSQKPDSMGTIDWYETTSISEPKKMLEDAIYITTDGFQCASIRSDGTLWTWGDNRKGVLGTGNYEEGTVEIPQQIATDVNMVWIGEVAFNSTVTKITYGMRQSEARLPIPQMIIQKKDGSFWGCGVGFGENDKVVNGEKVKISADLVPVELTNKDSQIMNHELRDFPLGTSYLEVIQSLKEKQISYQSYEFSNKIEISHNYFGNQYACSVLEFSDSGKLETIDIGFGFSSDGKIRVQSSVEEVQRIYGEEDISLYKNNGSIIKEYVYANGYLQISSRDGAVTNIKISKYSILPQVIMEKLCSKEERTNQSEQDKMMEIPPTINEFELKNGKVILYETVDSKSLIRQYQVEAIPCKLGHAVVVTRSTIIDNESKVDQLMLSIMDDKFDKVLTKVIKLNDIGGSQISIKEQEVSVEYSKNPKKIIESASDKEIGKVYLTEDGWVERN
ncbi:RCC1-like domain-containing protein [Lachnoclostridium sp.]|uniref:RCC1-like domain-containing protein n=1 Tax=Lachnoclostridium sp. TaxID=2028282 RepID=UPI00289E3FFC|nr:hypothetical protein [Lachnoclostridium sp.]